MKNIQMNMKSLMTWYTSYWNGGGGFSIFTHLVFGRTLHTLQIVHGERGTVHIGELSKFYHENMLQGSQSQELKIFPHIF